MTKYVGITIGPIGDTLSEVSIPAALWFGSYLFSDITKRICSALQDEKTAIGSSIQIYSPHFSDDTKTDDGIGKFHDRIIFFAEDFCEEKLKQLIQKVKKETSKGFGKQGGEEAKEEYFLEKYLQIHYVVFDKEELNGENCILKLSPYLDALELMRTFPEDNQDNPFRKLFLDHGDVSGNQKIKASELFKQIKDEKSKKQFVRETDKEKIHIRSIEEIANPWGIEEKQENLKKYRYFAVVQADGDNITRLLKELTNENITRFSKVCLEYAQEAAKKIAKFGGMTIYAGGDDLLFLSPVENRKGISVFELCQNLGKIFQEKIKSEEELSRTKNLPTLSFGISIQHVKYPLYEAKRNADILLYVAKNKGGKDCMAIELLKHSGQRIGLTIKNKKWEGIMSDDQKEDFEYDQFKTLMQLKLGKNADEELVLHGMWHKLFQYESVLKEMDKQLNEESYQDAWLNLFDNPNQKDLQEYVRNISDIYYTFLKNTNGETEKEKVREKLFGMLRIKQFLTEKGDEK